MSVCNTLETNSQCGEGWREGGGVERKQVTPFWADMPTISSFKYLSFSMHDTPHCASHASRTRVALETRCWQGYLTQIRVVFQFWHMSLKTHTLARTPANTHTNQRTHPRTHAHTQLAGYSDKWLGPGVYYYPNGLKASPAVTPTHTHLPPTHTHMYLHTLTHQLINNKRFSHKLRKRGL